MFCPECGKDVGESRVFCRFCGVSLSSTKAESRRPKRQGPSVLRSVVIMSVLLVLAIAITISTHYEPQASVRDTDSELQLEPVAPGQVPTAARPPEKPVPSDQSSPDAVPSSNTVAQTALTRHQRRLADLRNKQQAAEMSILIERETIKTTLRRDGIEGVPDDEHERVQRLIREKESVDAAIREEEQSGGSEPAASTVFQKLAHHKIGETFSVGYWTYHCDSTSWSSLLGNGSSEMGRPDAAFAVIYLMMQNDDQSSSIIPPLRLVDSDGNEYEPTSKAVLQKDALDLVNQLHAHAFASGSVIFDVSQGRTYFLKVSGGMMSGKEALIDLTELKTQ
jgi:hypothetical protein